MSTQFCTVRPLLQCWVNLCAIHAIFVTMISEQPNATTHFSCTTEKNDYVCQVNFSRKSTPYLHNKNITSDLYWPESVTALHKEHSEKALTSNYILHLLYMHSRQTLHIHIKLLTVTKDLFPALGLSENCQDPLILEEDMIAGQLKEKQVLTTVPSVLHLSVCFEVNKLTMVGSK